MSADLQFKDLYSLYMELLHTEVATNVRVSPLTSIKLRKYFKAPESSIPTSVFGVSIITDPYIPNNIIAIFSKDRLVNIALIKE